MKHVVSLLFILIILATAHIGVAFAAEGTMPQSGDLCGGTLVVSLTSHARNETSGGFVSLSDLKIGNRVTLV